MSATVAYGARPRFAVFLEAGGSYDHKMIPGAMLARLTIGCPVRACMRVRDVRSHRPPAPPLFIPYTPMAGRPAN
eukprot:365145-Chlamydomonas_euryale.AAC.21